MTTCVKAFFLLKTSDHLNKGIYLLGGVRVRNRERGRRRGNSREKGGKIEEEAYHL